MAWESVIGSAISAVIGAATAALPLWYSIRQKNADMRMKAVELDKAKTDLEKSKTDNVQAASRGEADTAEHRWKSLVDRLDGELAAVKDRLGKVEDDLKAANDKRTALEVTNAQLNGQIGILLVQIENLRKQVQGTTADCYRAEIEADAKGAILDASDGVTPILGYRAAELVGKAAEMLMPERFRVEHAANITRAAATGKMRSPAAVVRGIALHKDGREIPVILMLDATRDPSTGVVVKFLLQIVMVG